MKLQDSINVVSRSVKLPASVTAYLQNNKDEFEDNEFIKGGVLQDFKFAWLANGSKFVVINIKTGHKVAAWTFGAVLRDFKTCVICVCEIPSLIENTKQLLIGLECDMIGGLVCLFHCQGSRVLRAVRLDCRISCLQFVEKFPSGPLQCFDGTVIIGTQGGSVLAFDLNRQNCIEAILHGKTGREDLIRDELNIGNLFTLSLDDINVIEEQRSIACEKDDHIAVQVNEGCFHNLQFILHGPDESVRLKATRERVFVTSLLYIPQLGSIVIGFNFGAFQLWNIMTLQLEYTSPINPDHTSISHLGFLEPCDDPRAFCYLWVIYSSLDRHEQGFPLATMYAMSYQVKSSMGEGSYLYQNFITCNLRFNVELSSIDSTNVNVKQMVGGRCLACHSLTKSVGKSKDAEESVLNLCQIVWECWTVSAITPVQSIMLIFDIDQWYKEQMPELTTLESNSYLSAVNLGDTLSHSASFDLCDVRIRQESLSPYYAVPRLEEHYYPNSLSYECICLTSTDVTCLTTVGVQRQLLSSLNEIGPSVLLHPTKIFMQCVACGLIPLYTEPPPSHSTSVPKQRQTILSIALEARLICFLSDCARDWATGSHSSIGCSLSSFTQWAWSRSLTLKTNANQLMIPLFDHSGDGPDANSVSCLESCTRQLGHLAKLFNIMLDKCASLMLPEVIKELKQKQKGIQVVSLYFQVVQWFLNVGLLPEFNMNAQHDVLDRNSDRLPYPVNSLVRYYQNRRFKLHCLNGENPKVENLQNKSCSLLFIDQFIKMECAEEKLKEFWLEDKSESKGLYPPPSLFSLLRTYLIPGILDENKHSLVLYVLVDYAMTFDEARYESVIRRLMQFPTMFGLSNNAIKITQAFWHLDHRDFELALDQLESVVASGWLKPWQHNVALTSLLVQNKSQAALQYLYIKKPLLPLSSRDNTINQDHNGIYDDDWETCCNLYLSRGLLLEAFNLTKDSFRFLSSQDLREQRMIMFLEGCKKMNLLSKVLMLPLSEEDEVILTNFLKALGDSDAHDLLIMYYLQRSRFIEAQHVNDNLKRLSTKGQLPYDVSRDFSAKKDHIPKTKTRDELVAMYCKTLPKVTRNLANIANHYVLPNRIAMPTPMTVNIQTVVSKSATYRSSIIQATINKANETWLERPGVARSLKRALQVEETPFICTPKMERRCSKLNDFEKMITTPEDMYISPAKKPRLDLSQSNNMEANTNSIENLKVSKEVETLLHTPVVERKSARFRRSDSRTDTTREATPQSILKVRTKLLDCNTSFDERHYAETDEEFDTASVNTQSDNLSRSIRFNIPSPGNSSSQSLTPTDLNQSFDELSGIQPFGQSSFRNQSSFVKVSMLENFHYSQRDTDTSPIREITTPTKRTPLRGRILISPPKSSSADDMHVSGYPREELLFKDNEHQTTITEKFDREDHGDDKTSCEKEIHSDGESIGSSIVKGMEVKKEESFSPSRISERLRRGPQPRRSLRNTPERDAFETHSSTRVLRSRSRTPEREIPSPIAKLSPSKSTPGQKTKKSLARIVLEANALSASKVVTKSETIIESFSQTIKEIESINSRNDSLLCSDVSEVNDSDIALETEPQVEETRVDDSKVLPTADEICEDPIQDDDSVTAEELHDKTDDADNVVIVFKEIDNVDSTKQIEELTVEPVIEEPVLDAVVTLEKEETLNALHSENIETNVFEDIESENMPVDDVEIIMEDMDQEDVLSSIYNIDPIQTHEEFVNPIEYQNEVVDEDSNSDNLVVDTDTCEEAIIDKNASVRIYQSKMVDESLLHSDSESSVSIDELEMADQAQTKDLEPTTMDKNHEDSIDQSDRDNITNDESSQSSTTGTHNSEYSTKSSEDDGGSSSQDADYREHYMRNRESEIIHVLSSDSENSSQSSSKPTFVDKPSISELKDKNVIQEVQNQINDVPEVMDVEGIPEVETDAQDVETEILNSITDEVIDEVVKEIPQSHNVEDKMISSPQPESVLEDHITLVLSDDENIDKLRTNVNTESNVHQKEYGSSVIEERPSQHYNPANLDIELEKTLEAVKSFEENKFVDVEDKIIIPVEQLESANEVVVEKSVENSGSSEVQSSVIAISQTSQEESMPVSDNNEEFLPVNTSESTNNSTKAEMDVINTQSHIESPIKMQVIDASMSHIAEHSESQKVLATPKRVNRRRSSAKSDLSTPTQTTPENKIDLDSSIARSTRSASKKRQLSTKDSGSPGSEDDRSVISSSSRRSVGTESSTPQKDESSSYSSSRKSRKSMFSSVKPNLSVIPEISQTDLERSDLSKNNSTLMEQYISSKRLTRHQKSLLEKTFNMSANSPSWRTSRSNAGLSSMIEETDELEASKGNLYSIDTPVRMEADAVAGSSGITRQENLDYLESDTSMSLTVTENARARRASSEVFVSTTEHQKTRRRSVDASLATLDESITESPGRPRRRSFNKALEALSTPKRRKRLSTDSRNDTDDGASDTSISDRMTPNIFKERISEMNQSMLNAIEEDDAEANVEEEKPEVTAVTLKAVKKIRKPASAVEVKTPDNSELKTTRRMTQLLTPLSKEEQEGVDEIEKPKHRRRTTIHKVVQPIEFVLKKK